MKIEGREQDRGEAMKEEVEQGELNSDKKRRKKQIERIHTFTKEEDKKRGKEDKDRCDWTRKQEQKMDRGGCRKVLIQIRTKKIDNKTITIIFLG